YPFITHTSAYMLEAGLYPEEWKNQGVNEAEMEKEYALICQYFQSLDWNHYELSNWARSGYECRHNQGYWNHTNYRGFGLSATSFVDSMRWENSASFTGYYGGKLSYTETLSNEENELEKVIYGLRTFTLEATGFDTEVLKKLESDGYIKIHENKILMTKAGIFRENFILSELLIEVSS
ncbi:hypothetical protein KBC86_04940, partial [Candidatus Gracilibacteria bacterium]|nr:hypothetical protein [Candidatus Gracilibacteria bacterium]